MMWIFVAVAAIGVFAVAAIAVGRESFRLGHQLPASIFDLDEAVASVAAALPAESQARLTHDEVRKLIQAQLDYLQGRGIVGALGKEPEIVTTPEGVAAPGPAGPTGNGDDPAEIVVADDEAVAFVLGQVDEAGLDVADDDAYAVIAALHGYLAEIGAVGPEAGSASP